MVSLVLGFKSKVSPSPRKEVSLSMLLSVRVGDGGGMVNSFLPTIFSAFYYTKTRHQSPSSGFLNCYDNSCSYWCVCGDMIAGEFY